MLFGVTPRRAAVDVPQLLIEQPRRFPYFLPGGCMARPEARPAGAS
jgi:hypothetical protein